MGRGAGQDGARPDTAPALGHPTGRSAGPLGPQKRSTEHLTSPPLFPLRWRPTKPCWIEPLTPADPNEKPAYTQLRKGRWYWEPPLRLRRANRLSVKALGADQVSAWEYARRLNKELAGLDPDAPQPGSVAWIFGEFFAGERFAGLAESTQKDYRWLARRLGGGSQSRTKRWDESRRAQCAHAMPIGSTRSSKRTAATPPRTTPAGSREGVWKWAARREHVDPSAANPWAGMELPGLPERGPVMDGGPGARLQSQSARNGSIVNRAGGLVGLLAGPQAGRCADVDLGGPGRRRTAHPARLGRRAVLVPAAYPELAAELLAEKARQSAADTASTHAVVCEMTKRPWQVDTFRHEFRRIANAAGIPAEIQFRDLRATAATRTR